MIPLRDSAAQRRLTPINLLLIIVNLVVFVHEVLLGPQINRFVLRYAMVPARVTMAARDIRSPQHLPTAISPIIPLFSSMFVHGGILHVAGNMLYLFIFGAAVEWRLGSPRYLVFYLASGVAAGIATLLISPHSTVPVIGASGAIAGVLGAYFVFYPRARVTTVLPLFLFVQIVQVPAVLYLLLWFLLQLYSGLSENPPAAMGGGVAWWAHVGGFLFGLALAPLLARSEPSRPRR